MKDKDCQTGLKNSIVFVFWDVQLKHNDIKKLKGWKYILRLEKVGFKAKYY